MDPKQPEKRKHGKRYALVGGVLVMLVACFLLGVLVGQRDGEPETALVSATSGPTSTAILLEIAEPIETATPTETTEPTMTPEATWTPTLTATPRPTFTATPVPTATSVPAATLSPPLTLSDWCQQTRPQVEIILDALETMGILMAKPMADDATWMALLAAQEDRVREADAVLRGIVPPEECREAHEMMLAATSDYMLTAECTLEAFQQVDPDLLERAGEYMGSATAKMRLSVLLVEAMTQ